MAITQSMAITTLKHEIEPRYSNNHPKNTTINQNHGNNHPENITINQKQGNKHPGNMAMTKNTAITTLKTQIW
jgi:hypothetical protein